MLKETTLSGVKIFYKDVVGQKPPLLLLHGMGSNMHIWDANIAALSENFRCITLDLPGHGHSPAGKYSYSMTFFSNLVIEFAVSLGLDTFSLAGHSMGGQIAIITAIRIPQKVNKMVLVAPAGFEVFTPNEKNLIIQFGQSINQDNLKAGMLSGFFTQSPQAKKLIENVFVLKRDAGKQMIDAITLSQKGMLDEPVYDLLLQLSMPVLVIFGEDDRLIPNKMLHSTTTAAIAKMGTSLIPDGQLKMIPQCGHYPMFEQAAVFNKVVVDFLIGKS